MRALIAIVLALFLSPALAAPLEFKGLVLDAPTTPEQVVEALRTDCVALGKPCDETWQRIHDRMAVTCGTGGSDGKLQVCNGRTSIAGSDADANVVIGPDGRLQRIWLTISASSHDATLDALKLKYGVPKSSRRSTVRNRFGAAFHQLETVWHGDDGQVLTVSRYGATTEKSIVFFSTLADRETLSRASRGDAEDL
jgi:hypothetical protein